LLGRDFRGPHDDDWCPTKRTPIKRVPKSGITPTAVAIFADMQELSECSLVFGSEYWDRQECEACKALPKLHGKLLRLRAFEWPAIQPADIESCYSNQSYCAGALWLPHAQLFYRELERAAQNCSRTIFQLASAYQRP
jgi:hypothetical protein